MGAPVVVVSSGGLPVTEATNGYGMPVTVATNGFGTPITIVSAGGLPVVGSGPNPDPGFVLLVDSDGNPLIDSDVENLQGVA